MLKKILKFAISFSGQFFKSFLIGFIATTCLVIYNVADKTLDDIWAESKIPYEEVKSEYLTTLFISDKRTRLFDMGFSDNNIIENALKAWQERVNNRAYKKIPEKSILRLWFEAKLNVTPYVNSNRNFDSSSVNEKSLKILKNLAENWDFEPQLMSLNKQNVYAFATENFLKDKGFTLTLRKAQELIDHSNKIIFKVKEEINSCKNLNLCFDYFYSVNRHINLEILLLNLIDDIKVYCQHPTLQDEISNLNTLTLWYKKYIDTKNQNNSDLIKNSAFSRNFKEKYLREKKNLYLQCNIKLNQLED